MPVQRLTTAAISSSSTSSFSRRRLILLFTKTLLLQFSSCSSRGSSPYRSLGDFIQVVSSFRPLNRLLDFLDMLADFSELAHRILFGFPARLQGPEIAVFFGQFFFDRLEASLAASIRFLFERFPLDLELHHFP